MKRLVEFEFAFVRGSVFVNPERVAFIEEASVPTLTVIHFSALEDDCITVQGGCDDVREKFWSARER